MKKPAWLTGKGLMSKSIFLVIGGVVIFITYALVTGSLRAGFGADETITKSEKRDKQGTVVETTTATTFQDAKTLWDLLSLAGVPLSLAILGYVLQQLQQAHAEQQAKAEKEIADQQAKAEKEIADQRVKVEKEIAESNQREEALQNYLDRLSDLLIDKNVIAIAVKLQSAKENQSEDNPPPQTTLEEKELLNAAIDVIRARTLSILRRLGQDGERKGDVIRFLIEAEVVSKLNLNFSGADLTSADLSRTNLSGADLTSVNLSNADLSFATLSNAKIGFATLSNADLSLANLNFANLNFANLSDAKLLCTGLSGAKLVGVKLVGADLTGANLSGANFSGANFSGTDISDVQCWTKEQLAAAKLCNTMLPEGCNLNPNRDCEALSISLDPPATDSPE